MCNKPISKAMNSIQKWQKKKHEANMGKQPDGAKKRVRHPGNVIEARQAIE